MSSTAIRNIVGICLVFFFSLGATAQQCALEQGVHIAMFPAHDQNVIPEDDHKTMPVVVFGSAELDVQNLDLSSLELKVHPLWRLSKVESEEDRALCEFSDVGSPALEYGMRVGPKDGYIDVLCQFDNDLAIMKGSIQPVKLTGVVHVNGTATRVAGHDYASGPDGINQIYRCCISCDDNGSCSGCNADTECVGFLARECEGNTICLDCTGCTKPRIC